MIRLRGKLEGFSYAGFSSDSFFNFISFRTTVAMLDARTPMGKDVYYFRPLRLTLLKIG